MLTLAAIAVSTLGVFSLSTPDKETSREVKIEKDIEVRGESAGPMLQRLLKGLGGTFEIDVEVHASGDDADFDVTDLNALFAGAEGSARAITIGPGGEKYVVERDLRDVEGLLKDLGLEELLGSIDLQALLAHGSHGEHEGHWDLHTPHAGNAQDMRAIDMDMNMAEHMRPQNARRMHAEIQERAQHHVRRGQNGHGYDHDGHDSHNGRGLRTDRDGHGGDVEHLMHELEAAHMEIRELHGALEEMHYRMQGGAHERHDDWDNEGHHEDNGAERFARAAESFMEQLQYARAVGAQLTDDTGVALLGIWYASESLEPEPCLDLMVSLMNDEAIARNVRRAAGFVAIESARQLGNDDGAQRILGAIIRGAGATATDRQKDRAPNRDKKKGNG